MLSAILVSIVLLGGYFLSGVQYLPRLLAIMSAGLFGLTALVFLALSKRREAAAYALQALVFAGAFFVIHGVCKLENRRAARGAVEIAGAYDAYKAKNGKYPEKPALVVPEYLKGFRDARHTIMWASYRVAGGKVMYVVEPGLMGRAYDMASKEWSSVSMEQMYPTEKK